MDVKDLEMEKDAEMPQESGTEGENTPGSIPENIVRMPGYQSQYTDKIQQAYQDYSSRQPFTYDVNSDAMYEALKNQYISGGQMAMMDTMGQAATLTGGYGNSYAQGAGQQAYQQYLQGLNDQIPDLYQMALENYMAQGDQMLQNYGMLMDMDNMEYGRYMDNVDMVQAQVLEMLRAGYRPSDEMLAASGLSSEYVDAMFPQGGAGSGMGLVESWYNWKARQEALDKEPKDGKEPDDDIPNNPTSIYYTAVVTAKNGDPQGGYDQLAAANRDGLLTDKQFSDYKVMYDYAWGGKYE